MKRYSAISILALSVFSGAVFTDAVTVAQHAPAYMTAMDGQFEQNPKLADLLPILVNGPKEADANGSTYERPRGHKTGPHELTYQTWQEYCYRNSAPGMNPSLAKDQMKALLAGNEATPEVKVWMMKQFQWIGTEADVDALAPFLTSQEYTLRDEAIRTISAIPGQKSVDVLNAAYAKADDADKQRITDALAQRTQDISTAVETEFPQALPYVTDAQVEAYVRDYAKFSTELKIRTLASLTVRGDRKYLPLALDALNAEGEDADFLRREGILALEKLATANEVPVLVKCLAFDRGLTIRVASVIEADGFDEALILQLDTEDSGVFSAVSEILANRYVNVLEQILAKINAENCSNRLELLKSAAKVASKADVPVLTDTLSLFPFGRDRDEAEKQIAAICAGDSAPVLAKERDLALILSLLGRIGDDAAWKLIDENLKVDSMRDAAVRGLCNLPNARQAEKMLAVVDGNDCSEEQKIQALRAYIRVVSLPDDQIGIQASGTQKLEWLRGAMNRAKRIDEKKLVLSRLNAIREPASAKFAMEFAADPELQQDAYRAVVDLAHHNGVRRADVNFFREALTEIIEKSKDKGLADRAAFYRGAL